MELSKKRLDELKVLMEKDSGKTYTDAEVADAGYRLVGLVEICFDSYKRDCRRKQKLKEHPRGFHLDDGTYSCLVCHKSIEGESSWWDLLGQKCMLCQQAIWDKVVPSFVCKNSDSYYAMWQLKDKFGIHTQQAKKMVREGKIKARIILNEEGKPYEYLFLKKENKNLLTFERNHRYMSSACKCLDLECEYCYRVICLQKDCKKHPQEGKSEPRASLITELVDRKVKSMERVLNQKLEDNIRSSNLRSAEDEERHINILKESLVIGESS